MISVYGGIVNQSAVRIVIAGGGTGGHVQPAIAVAEVIRNRADVELFWIGSSTGVERDSAYAANIPFRTIPAGKLRRYASIHTVFDAVRIPIGVIRARLHVQSIKPDVVFSTGGFVSVPTVVAAWLAGIPIITHEQTATIGLANRINARFADRIALAYQDTVSLLPKAENRTVVTGNPVRSELLRGDAKRLRNTFDLPTDLPVVYVTGGALGAQMINKTVALILPELLQGACVIHQCGPSAVNGDFPRLQNARLQLPSELQTRYVIRERIGSELADIYAGADVVIGRSGAGTVAELALLGKPSILIPLPGASGDEQTRNARMLSDAEAAVLLPQTTLNGERLMFEIRSLLEDNDRRASMSLSASSVAQPDAADFLASEILRLAGR
jgi:UDP-N-acetylglucosamine--N-acetylmuramyl-(pentapeptide) pyrophosphoryl-undecaprenol N-acetylglucosamine transferase